MRWRRPEFWYARCRQHHCSGSSRRSHSYFVWRRGTLTHGIWQREVRVRWRLEFYSERRQILAHYRVEAPTTATALVLGRRWVFDEYPPTLARRPRSLFARAQRVASQHADA